MENKLDLSFGDYYISILNIDRLILGLILVILGFYLLYRWMKPKKSIKKMIIKSLLSLFVFMAILFVFKGNEYVGFVPMLTKIVAFVIAIYLLLFKNSFMIKNVTFSVFIALVNCLNVLALLHITNRNLVLIYGISILMGLLILRIHYKGLIILEDYKKTQ